MPEYAITFARSARRELEKFPPAVVERLFPAIEALGNTPRPFACKKLRGPGGFWRIRVGNYRILYSIDDGSRLVDIIAVGDRKDIYRG